MFKPPVSSTNLRELTLWLNRLMIHLTAGDSISQALERSIESGVEGVKLTFEVQLGNAIQKLNNRASLHEVLQAFAASSKSIEVSRICAILLTHSKSGGGQLVDHLQQYSAALWRKRKVEALKRGETASSRLLFPMTVMFLATLVIVGAPAVLSLN